MQIRWFLDSSLEIFEKVGCFRPKYGQKSRIFCTISTISLTFETGFSGVQFKHFREFYYLVTFMLKLCNFVSFCNQIQSFLRIMTVFVLEYTKFEYFLLKLSIFVNFQNRVMLRLNYANSCIYVLEMLPHFMQFFDIISENFRDFLI